jgi:hypothetical protein
MKFLVTALALASAAIAAPAAATIHTVSGTGSWILIDPASTSWTGSEPIAYSFAYDDTAPAGFAGAYTVVSFAMTIGSSSWSLTDYVPAFTPTSFYVIGIDEIFYTGINAEGTALLTGTALLGQPPQTFLVSDIGSADGDLEITNLGVLAAATVPEPAGWMMLIAGFGLTGAALRRRRTVATI